MERPDAPIDFELALLVLLELLSYLIDKILSV